MGISPVSQRVDTLDVLRGVAICGMFSVNMTADVFWADDFDALPTGSADWISLLLVNLFASGKFITIFAFLFGVGFYVQAERQLAAGRSVPAFWLKRLTGLFLIGMVANALTIPAWILVEYSLYGLALLLFYRLKPRWILATAIGFLVIERFVDAFMRIYWPSPETGEPTVSYVVDAIHELESFVAHNGSFLDISSSTLIHMWEELTWPRFWVLELDVFVLMLLGLYVGRLGAVWNRDVRLTLAKQTVGWLLAIGFAGCIAWIVMSRLGIGEEPSTHLRFARNIFVWPMGTSMVGLGYAAAITLLMDHDKWRGRLMLFAPIGRMALTNYLFTGLVLAFISYPWGLGLYGEFFPFTGLLIVIACLPVQALVSRWWLGQFIYGPFEWLWRCWTYGRPPRWFRLEAAP